MAGPAPIVADLRAESDDLDALVAPLPAERWADPTPSPGWSIAHQIAHLFWTDRVSLTSITDEAGFAEVLAAATVDPAGFVDAGAEELAAMAPGELLADWRVTRARLYDALLTVPDGRKLPWFGPPMSAAYAGSSVKLGQDLAPGNRDQARRAEENAELLQTHRAATCNAASAFILDCIDGA